LLTQSVEDLPFDLRSYRVIAYSTRFDEIGKLAESLEKVAEKAKSNSIDFSNPVIDFLPIDNDSEKQLVEIEHFKPTVFLSQYEPDEEKGLWDFVMEGESSLQKVAEVITRITAATLKIGQRMNLRNEEALKAQADGGAGSAGRMYRLVDLSATEISSFADKIELDIPELHSCLETFSESTTGMLRTAKIRTPEDRAEILTFRDQLLTFSDSISKGLTNTKSFRESQSCLQGISRSMNRSSRKSTIALDKLISEFEQFLSYTTKIVGMIDDLLKGDHNG